MILIRPLKHGLEALQEIRLSAGRITHTYSIYLTWIDPGQEPVEDFWLCMYVFEALFIS